MNSRNGKRQPCRSGVKFADFASVTNMHCTCEISSTKVMKDRGITPRPAQTGMPRQISIVSNSVPKTGVSRQISVVSNSAVPPLDYDDILPPPSPPPPLSPHDYDDPGMNECMSL